MFKTGHFLPTLIPDNQKVKSTIVTEVTVRSTFVIYSSQNPRNFLDMEELSITWIEEKGVRWLGIRPNRLRKLTPAQ